MKRLNLDNGECIEIDGRGTVRFYNKNGELSRENGPAIVGVNGHQEWWLNGQRHRADGPAVVWVSGSKEWWNNGKRHRENGPAVVCANGDQEWWLNGKLHREDGKPAFVGVNGYQAWYLNGKRHRVDGPAAVDVNGYQSWFLNDIHLSEQDHARAVAAMKNESDRFDRFNRPDCSGRTVVIDGKEYRLQPVDSK